ncbi:MAG: glycosyltransferase family 1 protein [Rhodopirellula sp.]|nr:glycosyltransferase family 1 protein [Rhodopirellula sp.]
MIGKTLLCLDQVIVFHVSLFVSRLFARKEPDAFPKWIVGVSEIAGILQCLGRVIPSSRTVSLSKHIFYSHKYDYDIKTFGGEWVRGLYAPALLGHLVRRATHFLYVGSDGFFRIREVELFLLRQRKKKIVFVFTGSDIRSPFLMIDKCRESQLDHFMEYIGGKKNDFTKRDRRRKKIAELADRYADVVFSAPVDQISYLKQKQYPFIYAFDQKGLECNEHKFDNPARIKVLHAPSNPLVKGTPLVRAAVKKLKMEGYEFDYIELRKVSNDEVLRQLRDSHIVLNQFYAFMPGIFGIEAMSNGCALLTSADPDLEPSLPDECRGAWMVTGYWQVYDNLKELLDCPDLIHQYALAGLKFVREHCSCEAAREKYDAVFRESGLYER